MRPATILIVEDEPALRDVLVYNLEVAGFRTLIADNGTQGFSLATRQLPDLVLLDLMLPGMNGLEVCQQLRDQSATDTIPIIMLTARSEEIDELIGFQAGADDYVAKPFKMKPLIERIRALLRRAQQKQEESPKLSVVTQHGIYLDRIQHISRVDEQPLKLTLTEFTLLWQLMENPGRVYTRAELMQAAMGDDTIVLERTIDVHIRAIRKKLGSQSNVIETVRGVGYRFQPE